MGDVSETLGCVVYSLVLATIRDSVFTTQFLSKLGGGIKKRNVVKKGEGSEFGSWKKQNRC